VLDEGHFDTEEVAKFGSGKQIALGTVGEDTAVFHHDDPVDFGKDVGQVMGDHENADTLLGDTAESLAKLALGGEVEGVRRFVEEKHFRLMDEGAGDHDAALFAGRHLAHELGSEVISLHEVEGLAGAGSHFGRDVEVGPEGGGGEESGNNGVEAAGDGRALAGEFRGDDAEVGAELRDIPALAAEEAELRGGGDDGIALAGDGFDECGFAAAVGTEDGDVFAVGDAEGDVMEDDVVAAGDGDIVREEEIGLIRCGELAHQKIIAERDGQTDGDMFRPEYG
jgi:hypothetical protein